MPPSPSGIERRLSELEEQHKQSPTLAELQQILVEETELISQKCGSSGDRDSDGMDKPQ